MKILSKLEQIQVQENRYKQSVDNKLIIPLVERFASKYAYNKLTMEVFRTVLAMLGEKAQKPLLPIGLLK